MPVSYLDAAPEDLPAALEGYHHYVRSSPATFGIEPVSVDARGCGFEEHPGDGPHPLLVAGSPEEGLLGGASSSEFRPLSACSTPLKTSVYVCLGAPPGGPESGLYHRLFEQFSLEDLERAVAGMTVPNPAPEALDFLFGFAPVGTFPLVGRKFGRCWDARGTGKDLRPQAPDASRAGREAGREDR